MAFFFQFVLLSCAKTVCCSFSVDVSTVSSFETNRNAPVTPIKCIMSNMGCCAHSISDTVERYNMVWIRAFFLWMHKVHTMLWGNLSATCNEFFVFLTSRVTFIFILFSSPLSQPHGMILSGECLTYILVRHSGVFFLVNDLWHEIPFC